MTTNVSRIAASDDIADAAARLRGTPDQLAAQLRDLLDEGAPKPPRAGSAHDAVADHRRAVQCHDDEVAALRHRLASDFAAARGWTVTTAPLSVKELARRTSPGGNWHRPPREWLGSLFSLSFYRDGRRRACAVVAHLLAEQVDRERVAIEVWAAERELAATFPDVPSWQNPGRAVVVVLQPAEAEEVAQVDHEAEEQASPPVPDLAATAPGEPAAAVSQSPAAPEAADPPRNMSRNITEEQAAPIMRPIAPLEIDGMIPRDLTGEEDPHFDVVDPRELVIDEQYQRGLSPKSIALIRRIVENWS